MKPHVIKPTAIFHALRLAGIALAVALGAAQSVHAADARIRDDDFVGIVVPASTSPTSTAASQLRAVHAGMTDWSSVYAAWLPATGRSELQAALRALRQASAAYGTETPWRQLFDLLQRASGGLSRVAASPSQPGYSALVAQRNALTLAGREIALQLQRMAARAGATSVQLQQIQGYLTAGNNALAGGNHGGALQQYGGATDFAANVATFDIDRFEQEIRERMDGRAVGYSYAIVRNGLLHASDGEGLARRASPRNTLQSATKPMYIASVSKTVSALTMMRTLQLAGVSLDASIDPYLPSYWTRGSNIAQVTFRHLMSHRSGLDVGPDGSNPGATTGSVTGQGIQALRNVIAAGVDVDNMLDEGASTPYVNANFGLLRVLAPMVLFGEAYHTGQMDVAKTNEDEVFSASFSELASVLVLEPTGMAPTACGPRETAGKQTMYYNINNASSADLLNHAIDGNPQRVCGATGFHLSAIELGGILAHLRYTDHIINASMRSQMNASSLGWLNPVRFGPQLDGEFGSYRAHGGDSSASNTAAGVATCMMDYPINVQAVLLLNSRGGPTGAAVCALLRDAYDASWTAP